MEVCHVAGGQGQPDKNHSQDLLVMMVGGEKNLQHPHNHTMCRVVSGWASMLSDRSPT